MNTVWYVVDDEGYLGSIIKELYCLPIYKRGMPNRDGMGDIYV